MAIKYTVVHRKDLNNVGDMAAEPLQYFLNKDEYEVIDISEFRNTSRKSGVPVIVGGGGLLANQFFGDTLKDVLSCSDKLQLQNIGNEVWKLSNGANHKPRTEFMDKLNILINHFLKQLEEDTAPRIIWGAGHNAEYQKKLKGGLEYPSWLTEFDLVGIRDYAQQYEYVPCASCMHPALKKRYPIKNDIIWFEHKKQLIKSTEFGNKPIPRFVNSGSNIEQTIELLGSANVIVTNSYHGAYWGTLLGKRVIVVEPWSSKFNCLKYQPYFLNKNESIDDIIDSVPTYSNALDESIITTNAYWKKIREIS